MKRLIPGLVRLRRRALGYRFTYDPAFHERLVEGIAARYGDDLHRPDAEQRRLARTAAHYEAQLAQRARASIWAFEIASVAALPLYLLAATVTTLMHRLRRRETRPCDALRLVFPDRFPVNPEIFLIPPEVAGVVVTRSLAGQALTLGDVAFVLRLLIALLRRRTPFPLQFALKCAVDLGQVRAAMDDLAPACLLVYWEFNCALTPVAWRMSQEGIATYNVMHGDKTFFAKHAFFEVDRCYCWNAAYADMFRRLRARADFRIFANPAFRLSAAEVAALRRNPPEGIGVVVPAPITLGKTPADRRAAAVALAAACNALAASQRITLRPHPFYAAEFAFLRRHLRPDVAVVTAADESPRGFILRHAILVGTASTMLLEAAEIGRRVIILWTPVTADLERSHPLARSPMVTISGIAALPEVTRQLAALADASVA